MPKFLIQITILLWLLSYYDDLFYTQAIQYSSLSCHETFAANLQLVHSRMVYVTPNATTPCPKNILSCHTLNWYNHNGREMHVTDNTMVVFMRGIHSLNSSVYIRNCKNLTLTGEDGVDTLSLTGNRSNNDQMPSHPISWIICTSSGTGIKFLNTSSVQIRNLGFDSCGSNDTPVINVLLTYMIILDCSFTENNGSVLSLQKSNLKFHGDIWFINNHADYGAAIKVCESSLIFLTSSVHIRFINNTASTKGGAVYAYKSCIDTTPPCLFQPKDNNEMFRETLKVEFVNNSAGIAGDAIYGGSLDSCFIIANHSLINNGAEDITMRTTLPNFIDMNGQTGPSWVSSDPQAVCFCNFNKQISHGQCCTEHPVVKVYPGQKFNVSMITVGQMNGSTLGNIRAMLDGKGGFDRLIVEKNRHESSSKCENISFILQSKRKNTTINFDVATIIDKKMHLRTSSLDLQVILLPCPLGFVLSNSNGGYSCVCDPILSVHSLRVTCDISRQEVNPLRSDIQMWFGCLKNFSSTSCELGSSPGCKYCKAGQKTVNVFHLDDQCLPGRTGVMCGACKSGLSHILESHSIYAGCRKCSNRNLLFLVPLFLISGILLVVFLTVFDITVTQGTLNGFVHYTTVAYSYPSVFRTGQNEFPWVLISWFNFDLGFEICAYNGMTGYQHIWLRFAYILYLLCIQVFIVYLSRKFIFFTRLVGKNVVNVLATITFLSYSQIVCTCGYSFMRERIFFAISNLTSTPQTVNVVRLDGITTYLGLKHIPLFILALILSLALSFLTFSLLFVQCLQRQSGIWCLRWVDRLRPFHEAFTGPCHNNYRFWPGFLFLIRASMVTEVIQESDRVGVAAVCFLVLTLSGIFPRGIYKKWQLNVLEFLFHLNISVTFAIAAYGNEPISGHRVDNAAVTYSSVSIAFILFIAIILYHVYNRIRDATGWKMFTKWFSSSVKKFKLRWSYKSTSDDERAPLLPQALPPVVKFPDFIEPPLED